MKQFSTARFSYFTVVIAIAALLTSCKKQYANEPSAESQLAGKEASSDNSNVVFKYNELASQTLWELNQARAATAQYREIKNAFRDGYVDINVVVPNMGYHFMKSALVDAVFDYKHPEILVYNKNLDGSFELLAVEYAVPIAVTPDVAPEGFTGSGDVWERNTDFGLWLQHAWIWSFNPAGVFHDTNPLITVN